MRLITPILFSLFLSAGATSSHADILGFGAQVNYWSAGYSGEIADRNAADPVAGTVDIEDDLDFDTESNIEFMAHIEHPVPVLPNVALRYIDLKHESDSTLSRAIEISGITFNINADVESEIDLSHFDAILYYELLDNIISLDLGLDIKKFDGRLFAETTDGTRSSEIDVDIFLPLLYASGSFDIPGIDLTVGGELAAVSYSGDSAHDLRFKLSYGFGPALIELGYRRISIDVEDVEDTDVDAEIDGAYLGLGLDF